MFNNNSFADSFFLLRNNFLLFRMLIKKELIEPYAGQIFGWFWSIGHPLFLVVLYTFIFGFVFRAKIGGTHELPLNYTVYILSGLIPWLVFQQSLVKGVTVISGNAALVKQVIFPLEVLPIKVAVTPLIILLVGYIFLIIYTIAEGHVFYWSYFLLPYLILLQLFAMSGCNFLLSALNVFIKDVKDFLTLFTLINMYIMPIVYLPGWVPRLFRPIIYINPFSYMIWCYQDIMYYGRIEHPFAWVVNTVFSLVIFSVSYRIFQNVKPLYGNFL